ncbi:ubiquitin-like modifier hub1 [Metarhizium acridum]|nr:ubiquitin-like modifier hub1 [Metarhizium acridum]
MMIEMMDIVETSATALETGTEGEVTETEIVTGTTTEIGTGLGIETGIATAIATATTEDQAAYGHHVETTETLATKRMAGKRRSANPTPAPTTGGEEMIIVHVNDRLGSKSAVPCLPSDTVGQFKIMVAARIGREPSQIMLRRQGERPFKDHITLEDYGISNGVQLDLEIDTGD